MGTPTSNKAVERAAGHPKSGDVVAGKYRIDGLLGEGGMGVVLAARHVRTGKAVALKWLPADHDRETRRRLLLEARVAGRIQHPNVVDVYDFGEHEGAVFLIMERLMGVPLSAAMRGPMTVHDGVRLLMPVLRGVGAAHAQGVIHRDLKPDNIFLCEDGHGQPTTVKVLDFGISKFFDDPNMSLTQTGVILGTPLYMAPEQLMGRKNLDGRCDIYALGAILYEMVEGVPAHDAASFAELSVKKLEHPPRPFAQPLPDAFRTVVLRALARRRSERFEGVDQLAQALEPFADVRFTDTDTDWSGLLAPSVPSELSAVARRRLLAETEVDTRRAWPAWLALALLAFAGAFGAVWWFHDPTEAGRGAESDVVVARDREPGVTTSSAEAMHAQTHAEVAATVEAPMVSEHIDGEAPTADVRPPVTKRVTMRRRRPTMRRNMHVEHRSGSLDLEDFD